MLILLQYLISFNPLISYIFKTVYINLISSSYLQMAMRKGGISNARTTSKYDAKRHMKNGLTEEFIREIK